MLKYIKFWLMNSRYSSLPQSVLPALVAICMASRMIDFSIVLSLIALLGVIIAHLAMNLFDDYFDYKTKGVQIRDKLAQRGIRARLAKCEYLVTRRATVKELLAVMMLMIIISLLMGVIIYYFRGPSIIFFALLTAILGIGYSGFPFKFSYNGLGELVIGLMFGPLLMLGVFYSACGVLTPQIWFISLPIGMLVTNIVYSHSIMDFEADKEVGKRTLTVLLNNKKAMLFMSFILTFSPFAIILCGVATGYLSLFYMFVFFVLPLAIYLYYLMVQFVYNPGRQFSPMPWMGKMENWDYICDAKIDWFMIRWYLARNIMTFFSLIVSIAAIAV